MEENTNAYNKKNSSYANSLVILQIPFFAVFMSVFFSRNKYFFADHFIFSLHLFAFLLLEALLIGIAVTFGLVPLANEMLFNAFKILMALAFISYTWFALRHVYQRKWWATTLYLPLVIFVFCLYPDGVPNGIVSGDLCRHLMLNLYLRLSSPFMMLT